MRYKYHHKYKPRQPVRTKKVITRDVVLRKRDFSSIKKVIFRTIILIMTGTAIFFAGKWTKRNVLESEKFKIKKINVSGFINVSEREFRAKLPVNYGDNVLLSYLTGIGRKMKKTFPAIKSLKVDRNLSGELNIVLTERSAIAWCYSENGAVEGIDEENVRFLLKPVPRSIPEMCIKGDQARIAEKAVALLSDLIRREENLYLSIVKLYNVGEEFFIVLKNSKEIFWGRYDGEEIKEKLSAFYLVLNDTKSRFGGFEYIDLQLAYEGRVAVLPARGRKQ
ncbi:MAG: FtsQ-type POTRA domain-containing protein [Elusimicrobiota bacterium]